MTARPLGLLALLAAATTVAAAAACSGGGHRGASPTPTPKPTPAIAHVVLGGPQAADSQTIVVVTDATGDFVSIAQVDVSNGSIATADVLVPPGGGVSAYWNYGAYPYEVDEVHVIDVPPLATVRIPMVQAAQPLPLGQVTRATITATAVPAAAKRLIAYTPCGSVQTSTTSFTTLAVLCPGQGSTWDVWVQALDATSHAIGWGAALAQPAAPGTVVPLSIAIDQTAFDAFRWEVGGLSTTPVQVVDGFDAWRSAPDVQTGFGGATWTAGATTLSSGVMRAPAGLSEWIHESVAVDDPSSAALYDRYRPATPGLDDHLDWSQVLSLGAVGGPFLDAGPQGRPELGWAVDPLGDPPDAFVVQLQWLGTNGQPFRAQIWAPGDRFSADVPANLFPDFTPTLAQLYDATRSVEAVDRDDASDWATLLSKSIEPIALAGDGSAVTIRVRRSQSP